jgi:hypothetical protein
MDAGQREAAQARLLAEHPGQAQDIERGVAAAAKVYPADGPDFAEFCARHYTPPGPARLALLRKTDTYLGALVGYTGRIRKDTRMGLDVADEPLTAADELWAAYAPGAHLQEDLAVAGLAAAIQLNFGGVPDDPADLRERSTDEWAALALSRVGTELVPAALQQRRAAAGARAEALVYSYNLFLGNIRFEDPAVRFGEDVRLISHWGLRDYMTNLNGLPDALPRQRAIAGLMERVARGRVPAAVVDNPAATWDLAAGTIQLNGHAEPAQAEGARRWEPFAQIFQVQRAIDPHTRRGNLIDELFLEDRRMPEARVEAMLTELLSSPLIGRIGRYVERRLGRRLEPFDMYFRRFQDEVLDTPRLDALVGGRYPTREALQADLPNVLAAAGFPADQAREIAGHIRIDNARGAGHAWPPATDEDLQLLRMRIGPAGVDWQEFGTFMHELGHCVEGVLSSYGMPYALLWGVPNVAFSEAFAFTFQNLALGVLGEREGEDPDVALLGRVWEAFEIAGPALVEMRLFRWLYQNPEASAEAIHGAVQAIADGLWADYFAPVFGAEGYGLLAVYSHMLWCDGYLPNYPLGYIIAHQVRRRLAAGDLAAETTRLCRLGSIYPDAWMIQAVGEPVSVTPLLADAAAALDRLGL